MLIRDGKYSDPGFGINTRIRNNACPYVKACTLKLKRKIWNVVILTCDEGGCVPLGVQAPDGSAVPVICPQPLTVERVPHVRVVVFRTTVTDRRKLTQTLYQCGGSGAFSQVGSVITVPDPDLTIRKSVIFLQNGRISYVFDYNYSISKKIFILLPAVPLRIVICFSWPSINSRLRIRTDLKHMIRIRSNSFPIHNST